MAWLGTALCVLAAWRLRATPLFAVAAGTAAANFATLLAALVLRALGRAAPRATTALTHVSAALGAFFLFVSLSM